MTSSDMIIPEWYHDFWCPDDLRKVDPQGCGIGLGIGAVLLLIAAVAVLAAVVAVVLYFWPVDKKEADR